MNNREKLNLWQQQLDSLVEQTGITYDEVSEYLGVSYARDLGYYAKLPKMRSVFVGIGMALGQPLDVINEWISFYAVKKKLYCKDMLDDLIWVYLINTNYKMQDRSINLYRKYEKCQEAAMQAYYQIWSGIISNSIDTADMDRSLEEVEYDEAFDGLKEFIIRNIDGFKTAYTKPRKMLATYVDSIIEAYSKANNQPISLSSLRGLLDDSMINYLSGSWETVNVIDRASGKVSPSIKSIPKGRRVHISLGLALGMTRQELNRYLKLMGFSMLDAVNEDDKLLIELLDKWEKSHSVQRKFKDIYIDMKSEGSMSTAKQVQAVDDMLALRSELRLEYIKRGAKFPYMRT